MYVGTERKDEKRTMEETLLFGQLVKKYIKKCQEKVLESRATSSPKIIRCKRAAPPDENVLAAGGEGSGATSSTSSTSSSSPSSSMPRAAALPVIDESLDAKTADVPSLNNPKPPLPLVVLFIDGEGPHVKFLLEYPEIFSEEDNILVIKLPAACSKTQQPNDVMKSYQVLHQYFRSRKYKKLDLDNIVLAPYVQHVIAHMQGAGMDGSSVDTYTKFFSRIKMILSSAFTMSTILHGWKLTGLGGCPQGYDPKQIMSNWPGYTKLDEPKRAEVLGKVRELADEINNGSIEYSGEILDSVMNDKLQDIIGIVNAEGRRSSSERNERHICVNQWRAIAFYPAFRQMIDKRKEINRRAAASRKASSSAAGQGQGQAPDLIAGKCITCNKEFQRLRYSRKAPQGFSKCKCATPHYFCDSPRCSENYRRHMGMEDEDEEDEAPLVPTMGL